MTVVGDTVPVGSGNLIALPLHGSCAAAGTTVFLYGACVLHPAGLRDLLVRLATTGMFRAYWSTDILDEMVRSILRRRPYLAEAHSTAPAN